MGIRLSEHRKFIIKKGSEGEDIWGNDSLMLNSSCYALFQDVVSKRFNNSSHCFSLLQQDDCYIIAADYCIGLDWLGNTGRYVYVEPKINRKLIENFHKKIDLQESYNDPEVDDLTIENDSHGCLDELDYLQMLLSVSAVRESAKEIKDLIKIDWDVPQITISQKDDKLTPFLVVQFIQLLKTIVRRGLKKSYYKVRENLNNRIKGKILVGEHIKQNLFKNRLTTTYCEYQVFGEDNLENRFLKKVLQFTISYVENHKLLFHNTLLEIQETINYCLPAFEQISNSFEDHKLNHIKHNPFFKEYKDAIRIGNYILKRFSYNITQTSTDKISTPPFWIDMPRLFELYVYSQMMKHNPEDYKEIHYQFSTYGNYLDVLISKPDFQMVIDAKYKLHYKHSQVHQDIRQVSGYARLKKVRNELKVFDDKNIDCLIIYPDMQNGIDELTLKNINHYKQEIKAYHKVYKLGVRLPLIKDTVCDL